MTIADGETYPRNHKARAARRRADRNANPKGKRLVQAQKLAKKLSAAQIKMLIDHSKIDVSVTMTKGFQTTATILERERLVTIDKPTPSAWELTPTNLGHRVLSQVVV